MDYSIFRGRVSVLCVGNELSGDDAAGLMVSDKLKGLEGLQVLCAYTAPENFIDEVVEFKPERVVVIDAADFGGHAGETRLLEPDSVQSAHFSTHRAPMKLLTACLNGRGLEVYFVGIQALNTGLGDPVSSEVENAVKQLVDGVRNART